MDFTDIIKPGIEGESTETVTDKNTANAYGSGLLDVYSTPAMIALMENSAFSVIAPLLPPEFSTVGSEVNIKHLSASPIGMKITAKAKLLEIDRRALIFKVEAFDEKGIIGEGIHTRFIVEIEKFMAKTKAKKS